MEKNEELKENEKIILSLEIQKSIFRFFLKTSMPRLAKQAREKKALAEKKDETI